MDGTVRRRTATPNRTKTCCRRKRLFLMDSIVKGSPAITNMILVPLTRNRWFLVDGVVRRKQTTPNMILALFKVTWRKKIMNPGEWNC